MAECLAPEEPRVLVVALLNKIAYARRWLGAREVPLRRVVRILWWEALLLIAATCAIIFLGGRTPGWANVTAPAFLVLIALMMGWSRRTWRDLVKLAPALDAIVRDPDELTMIAGRLDRRLRWPLQLLVVALGATGGLALGVLTADATGSAVNRDLSFVVLDAVTFALGANVLYWLAIAVGWFGRLSRLTSIELGEVPKHNPAIRGCLVLVRNVRLRLAFGLVCAQIPLVIVSLKADGSLLPIVASAAVLLFSLGTSVGLGVCRRLFLRRVEDTHIHRRTERLWTWYEDAKRGAPPDEQLDLYDRFLQTKERLNARSLTGSDASTRWLIVATAVGPLLPAALSLVLGLLGL